MALCHGGRPQIGTFNAGTKRGQIGLFLTLLDDKSQLPPPTRPHFDDSQWDERVVNSIWYLTECEHATSRALFSGLLPFAAIQADMCLDRAYVDLVCFDRRTSCEQPPIVLWEADRANDAYIKWENLPEEKAFDDAGNIQGVPWDDFIVPVAQCYTAFIEGLKPNTAQ